MQSILLRGSDRRVRDLSEHAVTALAAAVRLRIRSVTSRKAIRTVSESIAPSSASATSCSAAVLSRGASAPRGRSPPPAQSCHSPRILFAFGGAGAASRGPGVVIRGNPRRHPRKCASMFCETPLGGARLHLAAALQTPNPHRLVTRRPPPAHDARDMDVRVLPLHDAVVDLAL